MCGLTPHVCTTPLMYVLAHHACTPSCLYYVLIEGHHNHATGYYLLVTSIDGYVVVI